MKLKMNIYLVIPISILLIGFLAMQILSGFGEEPKKKKPTTIIKQVECQLVNLSNVEPKLTAFGRLTSSQPVILTSEVSGNILKGDIPFQPGQSFKTGQLLLKIDDRQIKLDINSAKSDFLTALATLLPEIKIDFPEEFDTWQKYFNSCSFEKSLNELPKPANQRIKLFLSRFNVYKLYFTVINLEIKHEKHFFKAPFNGSISSADLRVGALARSGSRLGEIINLDDMELKIPIPAQNLKWINKSKQVNVTSSEIDGYWSGMITRISKTINKSTQTLQAYIKIKRLPEDNLYDGIFLKAIITGNIIGNAIIIPRKAIYNDKNVYVVNKNKLQMKEVNIARFEENNAIVFDGLANKDTLVIEALQGVAPGMPAEALLKGAE